MRQWQPLPDGNYCNDLYVEDGNLSMFVDEDYGYAGCDLPDNLRLCRLVEVEDMPQEVGETIRAALIKHRDLVEDLIDHIRPYVHENDMHEFRERIGRINIALVWWDAQAEGAT